MHCLQLQFQRNTLACSLRTSDSADISFSTMPKNTMRHVVYAVFFSKYADRNKTKYAAKICGIMPRSHSCITPTYGNGESDSLCRKICDMHTYGKYANNAAVAYSHKTDMPKINDITKMINLKYAESPVQ